MPARMPAKAWLALSACAASIPLLPGLSASNIFYTRDLSLYFWGRYLWFRHALAGGEWPLWDPYVGAGQAAVADGLHQMFFPPALLLRVMPGEVLGFNLWVALPFPVAAAGAWLFFARRFSTAGATLGAVAFAASGVVLSTANFPNMSWSVAALPWVLWAVDRAVAAPVPRRMAVVALIVALQALAGEPVSQFATLALASAFALFEAGAGLPGRERIRRTAWIEAALVLGLLVAAIQLLPMAEAAGMSERTNLEHRDFWSLHPVALLETVSVHLFGDYYASQNLAAVPWMPALYTGREPFFFSIYLGVPLLALATFGLAARSVRRWGGFWAAAAAVSLLGAFGGYTPVYPFLRDHLPMLASFRFPVKYLVVTVMAVSAMVAAGWDALAASRRDAVGDRTRILARAFAVSVAVVIGGAAAAAVAGCIYVTTPTAFRLFEAAQALGVRDPVAAAEFMLRQLPGKATAVLLLSLAAATLMAFGTGARKDAPVARAVLFVFIIGDLLVHAWGLNPVFDATYLARPEWMALTDAHPDARFYVGGKRDGTLDAADLDSSRAFLNPIGLSGSASRAALSNEAAFYPSAWRRREVLSYDLAVLWPLEFDTVTDRFMDDSDRAARDRFLDRTGVRYRILPPWQASEHEPLAKIADFLDSWLYDWGDTVAARATVVPAARVVPDRAEQLDSLFTDDWDSQIVVVVEQASEPAGDPGAPVEPFARFVEDRATRVALEAGAGPGGGYLVLLDSYSPDWQATVDGRAAEVVRADGLFRAVRLQPGHHTVEFVYRPQAFLRGAGISAVALLAVLGLALRRERAVVS